MYGSRFSEAVEMGAITERDVRRCRQRIRIGQVLRVADMAWKGDRGQGARPIKTGKVTAKYKHVVTLDCGTSVTYIQILQQRRRGRKYID